ncbi:elmo ced-12 family protein [Grosmannia clavigera kw1407]|uniref:Elmo ced-12 family protein n=1 Tax=Grosmannia clavigera (strain kw1407 / UAMH 11150) TaxID=655863 RepID=F0XHE7_GROCL|nr:elmo ced-12 family protein [Grosmannia clavigera kw1407]EFX03164.1 elmo ced-12 family protein [Grosmannia clavigera kw1407]
MDQADIPALLSRLASDEDAARKMAVFKLQSSINDPAFADVFISTGGLMVLRRLILTTGGNTLAYSLQSLSRLLEVDMGWEIFEGPTAGDLVERIVELIVTNPLVNILRGAMSILVALVSHSQSSTARGVGVGIGAGSAASALRTSPAGNFGFRALKPAVAVYPQFFELVIQQLQSADHALCANALMLVNALIRDAVSGDPMAAGGDMSAAASTTSMAGTLPSGEDWSKMIKRLQDLGLIKAAYNLMQSSALQDLAHPLLEFQSLTKVLLRKWREVRVDLERPEHRRALKGLHLASAPDRTVHHNAGSGVLSIVSGGGGDSETSTAAATAAAKKGSRRHNPEKWRRLGFETESPAGEFEAAGFLGMMDLTDFVRKNEDGFQKLLLEQSSRPLSQRCPVARASLAVTMTLYEHFEVDRADLDDLSKDLQGRDGGGGDGKDMDRIFRPLVLQWSRLHTAGLQAFFRLWKATGAGREDFEKVAELVRILVEEVVGQAGRTKDVAEVEEELQEHGCGRLRELQMGLLELSFEDQWGTHLHQVREELRMEALQFVKEQRVRCLLQGAWFSRPLPRRDLEQQQETTEGRRRLYEPKGWRFVRLSHNRRYLHYADFAQPTTGTDPGPGLDVLTEKVDLSTISSVVSNVSAAATAATMTTTTASEDGENNSSSSEARPPGTAGTSGTAMTATTATTTRPAARPMATTTTKITVFAYENTVTTGRTGSSEAEAAEADTADGAVREVAILTLHPLNHSVASEWLDGLLMLLHQAPITAETNKLVSLVGDYGLKIRLLNVRLEAVYAGPPPGAGAVPSRKGLDDDYFYQI